MIVLGMIVRYILPTMQEQSRLQKYTLLLFHHLSLCLRYLLSLSLEIDRDRKFYMRPENSRVWDSHQHACDYVLPTLATY